MNGWRRPLTQLLSAILSNAYLPGWLKGKIYQGELKIVCVPFLNCYSCPGALGSCPVGAFQSLAAGFSKTVSLYVIGLVMAVGALVGRFACGWLCPFGLIQELLFRLNRLRYSIPSWMTRIKYLVLALTVTLPFLWRSAIGLAEPYFCKYICPAGTLEGGIPLISLNPRLAALVGGLFSWKVLVLVAILLWSVAAWRPFCRVLCPLGAFYGLFNQLSIWRLRLDSHQCTNCGACMRHCPAELLPMQNANSAECVRCLQCVRACPRGALSFSPGNGDRPTAKISRPAARGVRWPS